jgi:penicillin-insensitive murein DD-endopeptidase
VARIFVHPAIKRELCAIAGTDRDWLRKIRPWWGHDHHFHVRLRCPDGDRWCVEQAPPPPGDGCDDSLAWWFSDEARAEAERLAALPPRPRPTLDQLPPQCRAVLVEP